MTTVVGVHGIWNYSYFRKAGSAEGAAEVLGREWSDHLRGGLGGREVTARVAYYAHHLHRGTAQGADDVALLDDEAKAMLVRWVELLQPTPQVAQGRLTFRARQALGWLVTRCDDTARRAATVFAREVSTYLSAPESPRRLAAREAVATTIAEAVEAGGEPVTVVAHSLGSVVTYEALWAHPELRVDLLITLGSPLGMPGVVFERLLPAPVDGCGARPPGVARWVNLADIGDMVAVPRRLSDRFDGIDHDSDGHDTAVKISWWDFHTVKRYLTSGALTEHLPPRR
ncbi:hypothetical protein [Actinomadura sp. HBU206391]|uniref:hypothetical protein n=1 Tax=Actinomadura sp. HBU206391 TaxID=2731692 RepID=UPI00164FE556|nr:hypothetical protein [Actinomadura sp. HBU206391]MBC6460840.1 hypothetical protein [Actinomadura sp. HBU206391]